jgi:hypothetical protein
MQNEVELNAANHHIHCNKYLVFHLDPRGPPEVSSIFSSGLGALGFNTTRLTPPMRIKQRGFKTPGEPKFDGANLLMLHLYKHNISKRK